jgi:hypothetical protein
MSVPGKPPAGIVALLISVPPVAFSGGKGRLEALAEVELKFVGNPVGDKGTEPEVGGPIIGSCASADSRGITPVTV